MALDTPDTSRPSQRRIRRVPTDTQQGKYLHKAAIEGVRALIELSGEDPDREGLVETPFRVLKSWEFLTSGYNMDPAEILKVFADGGEHYNEMVVQKDIEVWSLCEHHTLPFFGTACVAYLPDKKIVGLSKLARLVDCFARRLQVQERLTTQVAHALNDHLNPRGVGVTFDCRHTCIECRGVQKARSVTRTTCVLGCVMTDPACRQEFLDAVNSA
jgi:GTP cyclohydrolase I